MYFVGISLQKTETNLCNSGIDKAALIQVTPYNVSSFSLYCKLHICLHNYLPF